MPKKQTQKKTNSNPISTPSSPLPQPTYFHLPNDKTIIYQPTLHFKLHNFPPESPKTFSYITRTYKKFIKGSINTQEVDGEPIYLHTLSTYTGKKETEILAYIYGVIHNLLLNSLPHLSLKPTNLQNTFLADTTIKPISKKQKKKTKQKNLTNNPNQ